MTSGAGASSLIAWLERELREIWAAQDEPGAPPMSRVCTMNLVVVAPTPTLAERYTPVVDDVTASIPARAIVASLDPESTKTSLEGTATAVCALENGRKLCSERIVLRASGADCVRVSSAVDALLVPEIPTALVWLGRVHADDPIFEDLAQSADRVLLDSEYTSLSSLLHVTAWARAQPSSPRVADMAWTRLASWHEMVARMFDEADARPYLERVTRVSIAQASSSGARLGPEPALLLGWLATRLGWKTSRLGGALRLKRPDGTLVSLDLGSVPRPEGVADMALARVTLFAEGFEGTVERELGTGIEGTRDADTLLWRRALEGKTMEHRVRLGANKAAKWLERTLHRPAHDPAFDESVAFAEHVVDDGLTVS